MNTKPTILLTILLQIHSSYSQESEPTRFTCRSSTTPTTTPKIFGPTDTLNTNLGKCNQQESSSLDPKCRAFCYTRAIGGLHPKTNLPDLDLFNSLIDAEVPEKERKMAKELIAFCFSQHAKKITDRKVEETENKCVEIAAFSACATNLIKSIKCD